VAEVAVIGVPDSILGNVVKAFVVPSSEGDIEESVIQTYCKSQLEPRMVPKYIELVSELPKTPNGKIDKRRLQSQWEKEAPIALSK
jgi:long-chain acyl-CoA synthetase